MKPTNLVIGILSFSALLMTVMLLVLPATERPVLADNVTDGGYRLVTTPIQPGGGDDVLAVYMALDGRMLTYQLKTGNPGRLELIGKLDLNRDFGGK